MDEGGVMEEVMKTDMGDDTSMGDENGQSFALLLRVTQLNGRPLPIGRFTGQVMSQMLHEVAGVIPKEVAVMNDQEIVMEFEEDTAMIDISKAIHGLFHCGGQSISVNSLVARTDLMTDIVKQCEVGQER